MNDDLKKIKQVKNDGWTNFLTGLGTSADKSKKTRAINNVIISDHEVEAIYADDGLGARVVDLLPDDMLKQGWKYEFSSEKDNYEELSDKYNVIMENLHVHEKICDAFKWARLYGGAIIVLGVYDGQELSEPLNVRRIKSFENIKIIPRPSVQYGNMIFQTDPTLPRYGEVEYYTVNFKIGNEIKIVKIHHSRVIEVHGIKVPYTGNSLIKSEYRYWGLPVLQRVKDSLGILASSFGSLSELMHEYCIGKYKFKDLGEMLSIPDGEKLIQNRVQVMDLMKSVYHSVYMDSEDEFIRDSISLGGVSEVLYQFMMMISASTGYPMTRLFGISPGGLNSTGDSDTYNYYDMVKSKQTLELKPILNRIVEIISEWQKLELPKIIINPLEQMTDKEEAELESMKVNTEKLKMETYQGYIDMGIMEPYMVEELEFGDTLKNIEIPEGMELPTVESVQEENKIKKVNETENEEEDENGVSE